MGFVANIENPTRGGVITGRRSAQFDEDSREWRSFKDADASTIQAYQAALAHTQTLGEQMQARYSGEDKFDRWVERCKRNIKKWAGEGIRVKL